MTDTAGEKLTPKETEILKLIGQGHTSKEIAARLCLSSETVANHRKHICAKLKLHSTAALVAYAARALHKNGGP